MGTGQPGGRMPKKCEGLDYRTKAEPSRGAARAPAHYRPPPPAAPGGIRPKCCQIDAVAMRPRGVRCR